MATQWAFLAPWWRILQAHDVEALTHRRIFRQQLRGLSVFVGPKENKYLRTYFQATALTSAATYPFYELRDALELALLLALVDRDAFNQSVNVNASKVVQSDTESVLVSHADDILDLVDLRWDDIRCEEAAIAVLNVMRVFLTQQPLQDRDPAFQDARRQILAQILPSETDKRNACENLKISVGIRFNYSTPPLELVRVLEASSAAVVAQNPDQDSPPYPFVAGSFHLSVEKVSAFTRETARRIEAWQARRAGPLFDKVWISSDDQWSAIRFGEMISDVFKPKPESEEVASSGSIHAIIGRDFSAQRFAQICSALLHTQHLRSLDFLFNRRESGTIDDRRLRRRWLMFALFSTSRTSVSVAC